MAPRYRDVAARLALRFDGVALVQVDTTQPVDVRLVIGQDLARGELVLRPAPSHAEPPVALAALAEVP